MVEMYPETTEKVIRGVDFSVVSASQAKIE